MRKNIVVWDGKDFAAVQMLLIDFRYRGAPLARIDEDWTLWLDTVGGYTVEIGSGICLDPDTKTIAIITTEEIR